MQKKLINNVVSSENNVTRSNKLYRDVIFKDIELTPLAVDIIDTPEFQRLDGIQQLGFASLVFRNAKHTRFEHSIGIYHESKNIIRIIRNNHGRFNLQRLESILKWLDSGNEEKFNTLVEVIGVAALLHDITHIPSGHALEDELKSQYLKHDDIKSLRLYNYLYDPNSNICKIFQNKNKYFSLISNSDLRDLIFLILKYKYDPNAETYTPFEKILEEIKTENDEQKKMILKLENIYKKFTNEENLLFEPFMSDIISNTISSDLLEYLKRDVWGTGLDANIDSRIEKYFVIKKDGITNKYHLVIKLLGEKGLRSDTISSIIELMELRYALAEKVYYHKTKVAADVMLGKLLEIVGKPPDSNPYVDTIHNINTMREWNLYAYVQEKARSEKKLFAEELLNMIQNRNLYKSCVIIPKYELGEQDRTILYECFRKGETSGKNIHDLEEEINLIFNDDKAHILIFCPPNKPHAKEIGVFVETDRDISPLSRVIEGKSIIPDPKIDRIRNLNTSYPLLWKFFIFIHPEDYKNELTRHVIIVKICQFLEKLMPGSKLPAEILSGKKFSIKYNSPENVLENWQKENNWLNPRDPWIVQQMRDIVKDKNSWVDCLINVRNNINTLNEFCDDLYVNELKKFYLSKHGMTVNITTKKFLEEIALSTAPAHARGSVPREISNLPHSLELYTYKAFSSIPK
jgi:hypothetical protein